MKKRVLLLILIVSLPVVLAECNEKNGGIEIEGECYDCGVADKVCPENFDVKCKIIDPDCNFIAKIMVQIVEWFKSLFK